VRATGALAGLALVRTTGVALALAARGLLAFAALAGFFGLTTAVIHLLLVACFVVSGL
jgi:hypothetical protein